MAGVITTANHPKLLWPGLAALFGTTYNDLPVVGDRVFDVRESSKAYEEIQELWGFGLASTKTEGGAIAYTSTNQGPTARFTNVTYGLGFIETFESVDDNQYKDRATDRTVALARSMRHTRETILANIFNRAFNSSYTGSDGKKLIATDHTSPYGSQSNGLATDADLSEASLEDMLINIMNATDATGLRISLKPKQLVVSPSEAFNSQRILKSNLQNDTPNNAINAINSMGIFGSGPIVWPFLTDTDAWFVTTDVPNGLTAFDRMKAALAKDSDFDTGNYKHKAVFRLSAGWGDWRGLYGSQGA